MSYETLNETEWDQVGRVWDLLDEGQASQARSSLGALLAARPGHPDLRIVDAAVALEEGDAREALEKLKGAERSADPALFFHLRALAEYELARFEAARADADRALAIHVDLAEAHDLLARIAEHLEDAEAAAEHAEAAREIDPETYSDPLEVSDEEFDSLVEQTLGEMPEKVKREIDQLPVVVQALPTREMLTADDGGLSPDLLGLFVGRSRMDRSVRDLPEEPGAIYIFRRNLLRSCADLDELKREIRITVQHEVGHLLGLDEDDLEEWGLA
ncbi:MAG TPA: metallopeptidase family protein [Candidatus Udaeobacter sp.]|jgi:predicted Zn-dependent protease with MMP-like domain|nr:metallopeptidase family protein [Candidatus Udaeobacter sp.]